MTNGYYEIVTRIKPTATPIDNVKKFAWYDSDYEVVEAWHEYTAEELARIEEAKAEELKHKQIEALPKDVADIQEALVEIAEISADNEASMSDVQDALCELAGIVAGMIGE